MCVCVGSDDMILVKCARVEGCDAHMQHRSPAAVVVVVAVAFGNSFAH